MAHAAGGVAVRPWMQRAVEMWTAPELIRHEIILVCLFLVTIAIDLIARRKLQRYRSKSTAVDLAYFVFYYFGPFQLMVMPFFTPLSIGIRRYAPWMRLNALEALPVSVRLIAFIIVSDILGYWLHRWQHASPTLWAFHKVHHSQELMTVLTNYRRHPADEFFQRFFSFFVFLLTGTSAVTWAIADIAMGFILLMQHSGFKWTLGALENVVISPRMHGLHHSTDPAHFNRNFGMLFSTWDRLFGTSLNEGCAEVTGVEPAMPESLWRHFIDPFREIANAHPRPRPAVVVRPDPAT